MKKLLIILSVIACTGIFDITAMGDCNVEITHLKMYCGPTCFILQATSDCTIKELTWYFDDSIIMNKNPLKLNFEKNGIYPIFLKAKFNDGCEAHAIDTIFIRNYCKISFSYKIDTNVNMINAYRFNPVFEGNVKEINWDFGDNTYSAETNPLHSFKNNGIYYITLNVTYDDGCNTSSVEKLIIGNQTIDCNGKISYNMLESYPPQYEFFYDGNNSFNYYEWIFNDGFTTNEIKCVRKFYDSKNYIIKLIAHNGNGPVCEYKMYDYFTGFNLKDTCLNKGTVRNYTGLDGCSWIIELDNGLKLNPVKFDAPFTFYDNQRIEFSYVELKDINTDCMVGIPVEIKCIKDIEPYNNLPVVNDKLLEIAIIPPMPTADKDLYISVINKFNKGPCNLIDKYISVDSNRINIHTIYEKGTYNIEYCITNDTFKIGKLKEGIYYVYYYSTIGMESSVIYASESLTFRVLPENYKPTNTLCYDKFIISSLNISNQNIKVIKPDFEATPVPIMCFMAPCNYLYSFSDYSSGDIVRWHWTFGDGKDSYEQNPTHFYAFEGFYNVCLEVTASSGTNCKLCQKIKVGEISSECAGNIELTSNSVLNDYYCNATAKVRLINDSGNELPYSNIYWSNGDTGNTATKLCNNKYYTVTIQMPDKCAKTASFAILNNSILEPFIWQYKNTNELYDFNFNIDSNKYSVFWDFGNGNMKSGSNVSYSFSDQNNKYVNIIVTDKSGNIVFSEKVDLNNDTGNDIESLVQKNDDNMINVYPNPANKYIIIEMPFETVNATIKIFNTLGKTIYYDNIQSNYNMISINNFKTGIYYGQIISGDKTQNFKFIKQ